MAKRIYVGNLPSSATEDQMRKLFSKYGTVEGVTLDKGFGFVEMASGAEKAIEALDQFSLGGKSLNVNEARIRK